jgi:putative MFS transporter
LGGIFWGVLGDKKGRLSVLFGSIFIYSLSNILNGFVHDVEMYRLLRFTTGLGLAGELGAGITLVSEIMSRTGRGWGTTLVASIGVLGVLVSSLVGQTFDWRVSYWIGGGMGMALLFLRLGVYESGMYQSLLKKKVQRGNFLSFFTSKTKFMKYLCSILVGLPVWYLVSVILTFAPEIGKSMGMTELPDSGKAVFFAYVGLTSGDVVSGSLSQLLKTRKRVLFGFLVLASFFITLFLFEGGNSLLVFYGLCTAIGFGMGFWAVFVVVTSEQFGTNLRATATTTVPNFVRGSAILLVIAFKWLTPLMGALASAALAGFFTMALAFWALSQLEETYGKNLDFIEPI